MWLNILNEKMKDSWVTQEEFQTANSKIKDLENRRMEKQIERLELELRELQNQH